MKNLLRIIVLFFLSLGEALANDSIQDTSISNADPKVSYTVLPVPKHYMFNTSYTNRAVIIKTAGGYEMMGNGLASPFAPVTLQADHIVTGKKAYAGNPIAGHLELLSVTDEIELAYSVPKKGEMSVTIYDISGRNVHSEHIVAEAGLNRKKMPISFLKAGIYIIVLEKHGVKNYSKFIKAG